MEVSLSLLRPGEKAVIKSLRSPRPHVRQRLLELGIITGAIWANSAWGTYWSWDPKETWSLITWFIYAAFLHARYTQGWRGRKMAVISICGFVFVVFTYWGVNYLLAGLHSYA